MWAVARQQIFDKAGDYAAFERVLREAGLAWWRIWQLIAGPVIACTEWDEPILC
jgi:hypothetical protein